MDRSVFIGVLIALLLLFSAVFVRRYKAVESVPCGTFASARLFDGNLTFSDLAARLEAANA